MSDESRTPTDSITGQPTMELLEGDAAPAPVRGSSRVLKLARGGAYGVVLLAASALLAVSAVPDLARYASFLPGIDGSSFANGKSGSCSGSSCTTLDKVSVSETGSAQAGGCCAASSGADELVALAGDAGESASCCESIGLAALLAKTAADADSCAAGGACCQSSDGCVLDGALAGSDEPIDAGSLLADASTTDEDADKQSTEERDVLEPDQDEVEE